MKEFCESLLMNGLHNTANNSSNNSSINGNNIAMVIDDDILSPFSDQKTLNELHDATDLCEEFDFDPSISLFNFNDDIIMHDYLFCGGTSFGHTEQDEDLRASPISLQLPKKNNDTLSKDSDPLFTYCPKSTIHTANTSMTALPSVEEAFGANFKIGFKSLPRRSSSSGDCTYSSNNGRTYAVMDNCTYYHTYANNEVTANSTPDLTHANNFLNSDNSCSNSSSSSSSSPTSSMSDCSLTPEESKDMVVLGVDISNLMHDYAMKPPQRQTQCHGDNTQYYVHNGNPKSYHDHSGASMQQITSHSMLSAYQHPNIYSTSPSTLSSSSSANIMAHPECIVVKTGTSLLRKSNVININKAKNRESHKLPHGAGHRMTSTGIDPMLSNYQVQESNTSSSGSPNSVCSYDTMGNMTLSSTSPSSCSSSSSDLLSSTQTSPLSQGFTGTASKLEEKVYPCTYPNCNKVYSKSSHLKAHLRRHTGEKPFHCSWPDCGWRFSRSDELARHKRSHSGIKPYKCDLCTKCFSRSDHLSKHRKVHKKNR